MKLHSLIVFATFLLCSCAAPQPIKQVVLFDEAAFQWSIGPGNATIIGSAFLKTRGGDVKVGAGNEVELIPSTPYTKERFRIALDELGYAQIEKRNPRLARYIRTTKADAQGNFEFKDVPAGEYILACLIQWEYATQYGGIPTGGQAIAFIAVAPRETKKVILTR